MQAIINCISEFRSENFELMQIFEIMLSFREHWRLIRLYKLLNVGCLLSFLWFNIEPIEKLVKTLCFSRWEPRMWESNINCNRLNRWLNPFQSIWTPNKHSRLPSRLFLKQLLINLIIKTNEFHLLCQFHVDIFRTHEVKLTHWFFSIVICCICKYLARWLMVLLIDRRANKFSHSLDGASKLKGKPCIVRPAHAPPEARVRERVGNWAGSEAWHQHQRNCIDNEDVDNAVLPPQCEVI